MSKTFNRESEESEESPDAPLQTPPNKKNYMTPEGHERLKTELHSLLYQQRPDLVQVVAWAASNGDRSENGDYLYGKKRLREMDRRIRFLTQRLEIAEVIDPRTVKTPRVQFGATVEFLNSEGIKKKVQIVGIDEINPSRGKISWMSPLAKALMNQEAGDVVLLVSPKGEDELEILKISYI